MMASTAAQAAKEKGNVAFKSGDYPTAIGHYTSAILADSSDPTFPLNRAAAYLKLGKYEDAQRDCTTVLKLSPKNPKAYFRRGQAHVALEKFAEAQRDLQDALRLEPSNESVKVELKTAQGLMQKAHEKAKARSKVTPASIPPPPLPSTSLPKPRRRRVPIEVVESNHPDSGTSIPSSNLLSIRTNVIPSPKDDLMKPVSSRPLSQATLNPEFSSSSTITSTSRMPGAPSDTSQRAPTKPSSFRDVKQARDSSKISRAAGGGIFRPSGDHIILEAKDSVTTSSSPAPTQPVLAKAARGTSVIGSTVTSFTSTTAVPSDASKRLPFSLFTFTRKWESAGTDEDRWNILTQIPATSLPSLFQTSLEPTLLVSMLTAFLHVLRSADTSQEVKEDVRRYMLNLAGVPRFSIVLLLMSRSEKDLAREVWNEIGEGSWAGL